MYTCFLKLISLLVVLVAAPGRLVAARRLSLVVVSRGLLSSCGLWAQWLWLTDLIAL